MKQFKQILNKLIFPPIVVLILNIPVAVILLIYTFVFIGENEPISYISYIISAYTTLIICVRIPKLIKISSSFLHSNKYINRYLTDMIFRTHISLYQSLIVNLLYAVMNFHSGISYHSVWFITLAVYYTMLAIMRFVLLRHVKRNAIGKAFVLEVKKYRICGVILLLMNIALSGVVILVVYQNKGFEYAGYLIYVMAMYTFYTVITAIINIVKYKKYKSPVMSAAKVINLAAALVSLLSLETAMLTQFDTGKNPPFFRQAMTAATGGGVCIIILCMAVFMIIKSTKQLKEFQINNPET